MPKSNRHYSYHSFFELESAQLRGRGQYLEFLQSMSNLFALNTQLDLELTLGLALLQCCLSPLELYQYFLAKGVRKHGSEALF